MSKLEKKIIAIGGGGFTHQSDEGLDAVSYTHLTLPTNREV